MPQEFSPKGQIRRSLQLWWVLVIAMILGGLAGYAIHHTRPPIFQTEASLYSFIDFQDITDVLLTEYDEDMTINTIQAVMLSNEVIGEVLAQATANGITLDYTTFMHQMSIDRNLSDYDLSFRDTNPEVAQEIVNSWMEIGLRQIKRLQTDGNIPTYLTVNLGSLAELPQSPTYSLANSYVLSGSVIGLVIGIILTSSSYSTKLVLRTSSNKKNKRVA